MQKEIITDAMKIRQILHTYWYRNFLDHVFEEIGENLSNPRLDADKLLIYASVNYQNRDRCPLNAMSLYFMDKADQMAALIKVKDSSIQNPEIYFKDKFYSQMLYDTLVMGDTYMIKL